MTWRLLTWASLYLDDRRLGEPAPIDETASFIGASQPDISAELSPYGAPGFHQFGGPVGRSIKLHKTDIKSVSSRDAARRAEVVRVVSSTISIKCPTRSIKASPTTR